MNLLFNKFFELKIDLDSLICENTEVSVKKLLLDDNDTYDINDGVHNTTIIENKNNNTSNNTDKIINNKNKKKINRNNNKTNNNNKHKNNNNNSNIINNGNESSDIPIILRAINFTSENYLHLPDSSNNTLSSNNNASITAVNVTVTLFTLKAVNIFLYCG